MKTTILTIAIAVSTLFGISQSTYAATNSKKEISTVLPGVSNISAIEVHGNVELYLTDGATDKVKVYNNYFSENAMVQDENGVLRISSYGAEKLVVWVTAKQLEKLSAYDNAEVKSFGKLSAIDLDVKLFNHASAKLEMNTYAASISVNDHAKADLTGAITDGALQYSRFASLNATGLNVTHLIKTVKPAVNCARPTEFAAL